MSYLFGVRNKVSHMVCKIINDAAEKEKKGKGAGIDFVTGRIYLLHGEKITLLTEEEDNELVYNILGKTREEAESELNESQ